MNFISQIAYFKLKLNVFVYKTLVTVLPYSFEVCAFSLGFSNIIDFISEISLLSLMALKGFFSFNATMAEANFNLIACSRYLVDETRGRTLGIHWGCRETHTHHLYHSVAKDCWRMSTFCWISRWKVAIGPYWRTSWIKRATSSDWTAYKSLSKWSVSACKRWQCWNHGHWWRSVC